jgi:transcriptional regulator with XRE-family HTH domain
VERGGVSGERYPIVQERLLIARRRRGLTQDELAHATELYKTDISKYERGVSVPTLARLARLAVTLGVSTDWLLGLRGEEDAAGVPSGHPRQAAAVASANA